MNSVNSPEISMSSCRFDASLVLWVARSTRYPHFLAFGETDGSTLLLGPHQWTVYNDSKVGPWFLLSGVAMIISASSDLQPPLLLPDQTEPECLQQLSVHLCQWSLHRHEAPL